MDRVKRYSAVFGIALVVGILSGSLFKSSYFNELKEIMDAFCNDVVNHSLYMGRGENFVLLIRIIVKRGFPFFLMWVLSDSRYKMPYIIWFLISRGFAMGFMCQFFVYAYTKSAFKLILAYYFPHYLLYAVVFGLTILYLTSGLQRKRGVLMAMLGMIFIVGALLEAYVNPDLLSMVVQWIY